VPVIAPIAVIGTAARITIIVQILVVVPSSAVTTIVIVFSPTSKLIAPDAEPLATGVPFTVIVALVSAAVGVTVILVILFATEAV